MNRLDLHIVAGKQGVACQAYGLQICWRGPQDDGQPPGDMMVWDTHDGAQKFADMNGGQVTTVGKHFKLTGGSNDETRG